MDAAAAPARGRRVIVLKAPGDREPGLPRWRRWAMDHRCAKRITIRAAAHAKQTPGKKRCPASEPEFALVGHVTSLSKAGQLE